MHSCQQRHWRRSTLSCDVLKIRCQRLTALGLHRSRNQTCCEGPWGAVRLALRPSCTWPETWNMTSAFTEITEWSLHLKYIQDDSSMSHCMSWFKQVPHRTASLVSKAKGLCKHRQYSFHDTTPIFTPQTRTEWFFLRGGGLTNVCWYLALARHWQNLSNSVWQGQS